MKTTVEIPDDLFRKVKSKAAERGQSLKEFVNQALREMVTSRRISAHSDQPAWMQGFGALRRLRSETARIQARVTEEFEGIEPEDRA